MEVGSSSAGVAQWGQGGASPMAPCGWLPGVLSVGGAAPMLLQKAQFLIPAEELPLFLSTCRLIEAADGRRASLPWEVHPLQAIT